MRLKPDQKFSVHLADAVSYQRDYRILVANVWARGNQVNDPHHALKGDIM